MFSSIASLLDVIRQANYASGKAFMDGAARICEWMTECDKYAVGLIFEKCRSISIFSSLINEWMIVVSLEFLCGRMKLFPPFTSTIH